jgi:hypothetical protein
MKTVSAEQVLRKAAKIGRVLEKETKYVEVGYVVLRLLLHRCETLMIKSQGKERLEELSKLSDELIKKLEKEEDED